MAHTTQDDAFHEIQLNGKQLIFLFMAATIVSVVIFLVGVMVGRGVRTERSTIAENEALNASPSADVQPAPTAAPLPPPTAADLTIVPPPPTADEASEIRPGTAVGDKKPAVAGSADGQAAKTEKTAAAAREQKAPPPAPVAAPPPAAAAPAAAAPAAVASAAGSPASPTTSVTGTWAVQIAAVKEQSEANNFAKGLTSKGYDAYVVKPQAGISSYRVRVGSFKTKQEANTMADKIGKEMKLKPWVTR